MYVVRFIDSKGVTQEKNVADFESANQLAKSIREFSSKVSIKKIGAVSVRWDVYLFAPQVDPILIESRVKTNVAKTSWLRWNHRFHRSVLVFWPSDVPIPINWFSSKL